MTEFIKAYDLQCAPACPFNKNCGQKYDDSKAQCLDAVQHVRRSFDNGAPARLLHLLPDEIEIITVDPEHPNDIMGFRTAAVISQGEVSTPR